MGVNDHVPKGYLAIRVGAQDEEPQRIVIPLIYFGHPLFLKLLKEAEDEYGFEQKGNITIPCHVDQFRCVQRLIDREHCHHHHHRCHQRRNGPHNHLVACFRV